jgi:hypothetical protein
MSELFRSFLNHVPAGWMAVILVGGLTGLAVVVVVLLDRFMPQLHRRGSDEDRLGLLRETYGIFYFFLLALVIANIQSTSSEASERVSDESGAIANIVRNSAAFAPPLRTAVDDAISAYVHSVVEDEFPAMTRGEASPETAKKLDALFAAFQVHRELGPIEEKFFDQSLDKLDEVVADRRHRLEISSGSAIPDLLRVFIIGGLVLFWVLFYPFSVERLRHRALIFATYALIGSFALLLTIQLDFPFSGSVSVSPDSFTIGALAQFFP